MGAKDCFILYADGDVPALLASRPALDRPATEELVRRLFPDRLVTAIDDGTIGDDANPEDGTAYAAVWPGATIVCTSAVALDQLFGFVFEGYSGMGPETVDPLDLTLAGFGLSAPPERRRLFGRR